MKTTAIFFPEKHRVDVRRIELQPLAQDEVRVRVHANGICMLEVWFFQQGGHGGRVMGHEGVGVVEEVGSLVNTVKPGDWVGGYLPWSGHAHMKARDVVRLEGAPKHIRSHLLEPVSCSVNAAAALEIFPGDRAVVFGAGYMGLLLIQLMRHMPLAEIIAVDIREGSLAMARRFGADRTINGATPEGQAILAAIPDGSIDLAVECTAAEGPLRQCERIVRPGGTLAIHSYHHERRPVDLSLWHERGIRVVNTAPGIVTGHAPYRSFQAADRLIRGGRFDADTLVTHVYTPDQAEHAMQESVSRPEGFIKSVFQFA